MACKKKNQEQQRQCCLTSKAFLSCSAGTGGNVDWLPNIITGRVDLDTSLTHSSTERGKAS